MNIKKTKTEQSALVIVPSSTIDTMNLGGLVGMTALAQPAPATATKNPS